MMPTIIIVVIAIAEVFSLKDGGGRSENNNAAAADSGSANNVVIQNADLVIPNSEISISAKFYPAEIDWVKMKVIAVKAPDGTTRTAFNTCQVCCNSGHGYYEQDGDALVCQN